MQNSNQMRFAMAIHMLQRSNPATRESLESRRAPTRRRHGRADQSTDASRSNAASGS